MIFVSRIVVHRVIMLFYKDRDIFFCLLFYQFSLTSELVLYFLKKRFVFILQITTGHNSKLFCTTDGEMTSNVSTIMKKGPILFNIT